MLLSMLDSMIAHNLTFIFNIRELRIAAHLILAILDLVSSAVLIIEAKILSEIKIS